eukprot:2268341-Rhodomonas_salina.1
MAEIHASCCAVLSRSALIAPSLAARSWQTYKGGRKGLCVRGNGGLAERGLWSAGERKNGARERQGEGRSGSV